MGKKVTIPETSEQLTELLDNKEQREEVFADPDSLKLFLTNYVRASNKVGDVADMVAEKVQTGITAFFKEQGVARPDLTPTPDNPYRNPIYNAAAVGAKLDALFDGPADYFKTIWHKNMNSGGEKLAKLQNYSSIVPDAGGFLIPETLRSELLKISLETAIVRPRARIIPMETLRVPFPTIDSSSNVSSVFGGIITYWTPESGTIALKDAKFGRVVLEAKKLTAASVVPNELLQDSIGSFAAFVNNLFPEAISFAEDYAFLTGSGVGEPVGVLKSPALIVVDKESGQVADSVEWENIVNLYSRMLPASLGRAVWVCSIDVFPKLATMALNVGTGGSAIWLNNGQVGPPMTILGRPVIFTEKVPKVGEEGDISFIDFGYYLVGDRQTMTASSSEHIRFQEDETMFKIIERVDGRGWLNSALTPKNSGATLSPFVTLQERS